MEHDTVSMIFDSTRRSLLFPDTSGRYWWDSLNHHVDSLYALSNQRAQGSEIFALILQGVVGLVLLAAWIVILYYIFKRFRKKSLRGIASKTSIYGAWQDHNLGTTSMEPGDLTRIEKEVIREEHNSKE
ncbi:MAG TPA: hypothetical protein VFD13_02005 [Candidatus Kapabacteria bacterium]|nr:hypothetical protein [Candidatus Kapabacteria bacterium]